MHRKTLLATVTSLMIAGLAGCGGGGDGPAAPQAVGDTIALTASGRIVSFNRTAPATLVGSVAVSGLAAGETLLGIDIRPADGLVYALGSLGRLYTVVPATGVATLRSTLVADVTDSTAPFVALSGDSFAVDFNPVPDRLRVVSNAGQNLRINVDTGATTTDGSIALSGGGSATVSAGAYTNSFAGATATQLFDLDVAAGLLHLQNPPNDGTLAAGLPLGVTATATNGFDIDARTNIGYAALTVGGTTSLYTVNLGTGAATVVAGGAIGGGEAIRGLALVQPAAPTAIGLTLDNRLMAFNPATPNTITSTVTISGLQPAETMGGIDFRPNGGLLYGLTLSGNIYTLNPSTGAATFVAALAADAADLSSPYNGLASTVFTVDFNPVPDRMRVITDNGQSLRINVASGATITDTDINRAGAAPSVLAAAYTNNFAGTTSTTLYDLEAESDVLAIQAPPNDGVLTDVGPLGLDITGRGGFDIAGGANGLVLAALRVGITGPMSLYSVNLTTGAATLYRGFSADAARIGGAGGVTLIDLAIRF